MACFLVPGAEAVVATIVEKKITASSSQADGHAHAGHIGGSAISWARKLRWLTNMLWGGTFLLLFEHVWHGEIVPWFPFLTASLEPADRAAMFHEMATVGAGMAVAVTAVWVVMVIVAERIASRPATSMSSQGCA